MHLAKKMESKILVMNNIKILDLSFSGGKNSITTEGVIVMS